MAHKGFFRPINTHKYKGNPNTIVYRSSWERKIMKWCDTDKSIVEWSSEEIIIPYRCPTDNKTHRYYPDFYIKTINNNTTSIKIVEVKPKHQTQPPKPKKKQQEPQKIKLPKLKKVK